MSQVIVLFHFLYVSCRSHGGRGWAYASLRFEFVKKYNMETLLNESLCLPTAPQMSSSNGALEGMQDADVQAPVHSNAFTRLRHRFLQFQRQRLQASQVFAIPCVESDSNVSTGLTASGLQLARPLFQIRFPGILVRFAETHRNRYICALLAGAPLSRIFVFVEQTGTATLVFNILIFFGVLGFFSCKRYNIDSVAAKHVSTSFRFVCICLLLLFEIAVSARRSHLGIVSTIGGPVNPQSLGALIVMFMVFVLCLLVDCSPNLPTAVQTAMSVRACIITFL